MVGTKLADGITGRIIVSISRLGWGNNANQFVRLIKIQKVRNSTLMKVLDGGVKVRH